MQNKFKNSSFNQNLDTKKIFKNHFLQLYIYKQPQILAKIDKIVLYNKSFFF